MANKWIFVGILLIAAIVILGCSAKESKEPTAITTQVDVTPSAPVTSAAPTIPLYQAPLDGSKIKKTCAKDSDCVLILAQTGAGQTRECISTDSGYEGGVSDECYCKHISTTTQTLVNGTDIKTESYECRHIA